MHTVLFCLQFLASPELQQLQAAIQRQIEAECGEGEPGLHHALPLLRATLLGRSYSWQLNLSTNLHEDFTGTLLVASA